MITSAEYFYRVKASTEWSGFIVNGHRAYTVLAERHGNELKQTRVLANVMTRNVEDQSPTDG